MLHPVTAGTVTLVANSPGDQDYNPGYAQQTMTIGSGTPTLTITSANTVYVDSALTATITTTAMISSGGAVTFALTAGSGSATVNPISGRIVGIAAGTVTLIATSAGDSNYYSASTSQVITVEKSTPTFIISAPITMIVDEAATATIITTASGDVGPLSYDIPFNGTGAAVVDAMGIVRSISAGEVTLTIQSAGNSNYYPTSVSQEIIILRGTQTLTIISPNTIPLGSTLDAVTATTASYERGGIVTFSITGGSGSATVDTNSGHIIPLTAGTVILTASISGDNDYYPTSVNQVLTIGKGTPTLTITSPSITVVDGVLTATVTTTATASSGGAIMYTIIGGSGSATINLMGVITAVNAGTVTLIATSLGDSNYNSATGSQLIVIGKATPTLSIIQGINIPPAGTLTATVSTTATGGRGGAFTFNVIAGSGSATVNFTTGLITGISLGTVTLTVTSAGDSDYNPATTSQLITIGANTPTKVFSFTPSGGPVGSTVVITGQNFDPNPANNVVFFGATQATVLAASFSSLTVTVPLGANYQPISVANLSTYSSGYSSNPFLVTFASTGTVNFSSGASIGGITGASYVAMKDLNGDKKSDLVIVNNGDATTGRVYVYRNTSIVGSPSYTLVTTLSPGVQIGNSVDLFDLDGDGKQDIVLTGLSSGIIVYKNTTDPLSDTFTFSGPLTFPTNSNLFTQIADLDGDGRPDIIAGGSSASSGNGNISILRNISAGGAISFTASVDFPSQGIDPNGLKVGDLDNDGKPDLAIGNVTSGNLKLFHNASAVGNISFTLGQTISTTYNTSINFADFDGDHQIDIAAITPGGGDIVIFNNTNTISGTISFYNIPFIILSPTTELTVDDFNGDGKPDIAATDSGSAALILLQNNSTIGNLSFTNVSYATGSIPKGLDSGDIDGDGRPDITVINSGDNSISVFQNIVPLIYDPPTITSFTPASGALSTVITISGQNFNTIADRNAVFFGATQATVLGATSTSITVRVPAGATYDYVSVTNLDAHLTDYSSVPFIVTAPTPASSFSDFTSEMGIDVPYQGLAQVTADFDGDGKPDVVVGSGQAGAVTFLRNITSIGSNAVSFTSTSLTLSLVNNAVVGAIAVDFDGDGKLDLAMTDQSTTNGKIYIYRNVSTIGAVSFTYATTINLGINSSDPYGLAAGDLDGDGRPDLVSVYSSSNTLSVIRNTSTSGTISFNTPDNSFTMPANSTAVAIGDIDGDGRPDVVAAQSATNNITVLRNTTTSTGNISLSAPVSFASGSNVAYSVAIGDFNSDGKLDIATGNANQNSVSVFRNTATSGTIDAGSFSSAQIFTTGADRRGIAIGDMDGDGKVDLVSLGNGIGNYNISILKNTTASSNTINFGTAKDYLSSISNTSLVARINLVDLNLDGLLDMVALATDAGPVTSKVLIYRNMILSPVATIVSFSPTSGPISTTVTITGQNFNTTASRNIVFWGATQATVTGATSTSLTVLVPAGASYQYLSVSNLDYGTSSYSAVPFVVTYSPVGDNSFRPSVPIASNVAANDVIFADFNADGKPDMAVANSNNTVSVLANQITSSTAPATFGSVTLLGAVSGSATSSLVAADINGDGLQDIVAVNAASGVVSVYRNTTSVVGATPTFASASTFATGAHPVDIAAVDIDGDGLLDIVMIDSIANLVSVSLNRSTSSTINFDIPQVFATGTRPSAIAFGDFNKDGKIDLAVSNSGSNDVSVLQNKSSIGSVSLVRYTLASGIDPASIVIGDFDGDTFLDIATANTGGNNVSVFKNNGSSTTLSFGASINISAGAGSTPNSLAIGDVDGDGKPDLITANGNNTLSLLHNVSSTGTVSFTTQFDISNGGFIIAPQRLALGDLNGDGKPDLVVLTNGTSNNVGVFLQKISQSLAIGSISPVQVGLAVSVTVSSSVSSTLMGSVSYSVIAGSGSATISPSGTLMPISPGTITLIVSASGSTDYASGAISQLITVAKRTQILTIISGNTTTVDGTLVVQVTSNAGSGGGLVTFSLAEGSGSATINSANGLIKGVKVGTVTLTVFVAGDINYTSATVTQLITIQKGTQTLTATLPNTMVVGDTLTSTITRTTTNGRGGAISVIVVAGSGSATINATNGLITAIGAGTITLIITANGDSDYFATSISQSITIGRGTPTLALAVSNTLSVGTSLTPTISTTAFAGRGGVITFSLTAGSGSATVNATTGLIIGINTGTVTLTASSAANSDYYPVSVSQLITINRGSATLTITSASTVPIGDSLSATVSTTAGVGRGGSITFAIVAGSGSATVDTNSGVITGISAGTVTLIVSSAGDSNYYPATVSQLLTIATLNMSYSSTVAEGTTTYLVLSLSPSTATINQSIIFNITANSANQATANHYIVPSTATFLAGHNSLTIPVQAVSDNIVYNDELLVLDVYNAIYGMFTCALTITDITSSNSANQTISLGTASIYYKETVSVTVSLPAGVTSVKPITIALSVDPLRSTNLHQVEYSLLQTVTIPANSNTATFYITARKDFGDQTILVITGSVIDPQNSTYNFQDARVTVDAQHLGVSKAYSPNGDGTRDNFEIRRITDYPDNKVYIFDRRHQIIYGHLGYNNGSVSFQGNYEDGTPLPTGTYYVYALYYVNGYPFEYYDFFELRRE